MNRFSLMVFSLALAGPVTISLFGQTSALHQPTTLLATNAAVNATDRSAGETVAAPVTLSPYVKAAITVVHVTAAAPVDIVQPDDQTANTIASQTIRTTAGAYSDIPRFLQTQAGVSSGSDSRNGYMVNGGNPLENTYVIDGVEIPNINHISSANSSGGFFSMIDTDAVSSVKLHSMLQSSQYSGALSSVLEIKLHQPDRLGVHGDVSIGEAGADLILERGLGQSTSVLTEARQSVLQYFTNDIGFGGVPKYSSVLSKTNTELSPSDSFSTLVLEGSDKLTLQPNLKDVQDPGFLNTIYAGSRATAAMTWMHRTGETRTSQFQFLYSRMRSTTVQNDAMQENLLIDSNNLVENPVTSKYDLTETTAHFRFSAGTSVALHSLHFNIAQPIGLPSPYRVDPTPEDASNINTGRAPLDSAAYAEISYRSAKNFTVDAGLRYQHFGLDHTSIPSPRLSVQSPAFKGASLFGGAAQFSQLPPLPTLLAVASNLALKPITVTQLQAGLLVNARGENRIVLSAFRKVYRDYPVSTEYASLSQADLVDTFGQPFLYMPMTSAGRGIATGVELTFASNPHRRVFFNANVTTQKVLHEALDRVWRRANFDMPLMSNLTGGFRLARSQRLTMRHSFHTGTPYTSFLVAQSQAQQRTIYDLTQINTRRGDYYARLDFRYEYDLPVRDRTVELSAGLDNVLGRNNFYEYVMIPHCSFCGPYELTQMGRRVEGAMTYRF